MDITTIFEKETSNYAVYACPEMDFRIPGVKIRAWIPKKEFEGLPKGIYPPEIVFRIMDNDARIEAGEEHRYDVEGKPVFVDTAVSLDITPPSGDDDVPF